MRTQAEILQRIEDRTGADIFGFECEQYLLALTLESIETLRGTVIKKDADLTEWEPGYPDITSVLAEMTDYMDFAWEKANDCRGISAMRTLQKYTGWLWLIDENRFGDLTDYDHYGKEHLIKISEFLGVDHAALDNGERVNDG